jgi:molecular chaperone GrpE
MSEQEKQTVETDSFNTTATLSEETSTESTNNNESGELSIELTEMEKLQLEMDQIKAELAAKNDQFLRKVAEFENMRKRVERERYMTIQLSRAEALNEFLPISDDLQRTLDSAKNLTVDDSFLKGVQLVAEKFENVLIKNGIEKINETGVPFDVNVHEALLRQPAPNAETPSGTVLQVFEAGYKMGERVIRHAKVIVSE